MINLDKIELALAEHFDYRQNLIVPNFMLVYRKHECDLLILSRSGYLTDIEIKRSLADLKADRKKKHGHNSDMIKELYFAIDEKFSRKAISYIPKRAGILIYRIYPDGDCVCILKRKAEVNKNAKKISDEKRYDMAKKGVLRFWKLKDKLIEIDRAQLRMF